MSLISLQHSGRFYEELPNTADYVSYRLACNKEDYPDPYSPPIKPPLSFLPQHPYHSPQPPTASTSSSGTNTPKNTLSPPTHTTAIFKYPSVSGLSSPPPGVAAYTFPKEQYVWADTFLTKTQTSPAIPDETTKWKLFLKRRLAKVWWTLDYQGTFLHRLHCCDRLWASKEYSAVLVELGMNSNFWFFVLAAHFLCSLKRKHCEPCSGRLGWMEVKINVIWRSA